MTGQEEVIEIKAARLHVLTGERWLAQAGRPDGSTQQNQFDVAMASAHFSAAMAITNVLLAEAS